MGAVAARCTYAEAGVGAGPSQNITDPTLGPGALALISAGPVHSAGMKLIREVSWLVAGILVDWMEDDLIEALAVAWLVYKPQMDDYLMRAQDPTAELRRAGRRVRPNFLGLAGLGSPTD